MLFDSDIVLVGGRNFGPSSKVALEAVAGDLGGSASANADTDGRFVLGFRVPVDFSGTVTVTARAGAAEATSTLPVNPPDIPEPVAPAAAPAPEAPVVNAPKIDTSGVLSGLPWLSGVHNSHRLQSMIDFGTWRGRPIDVALVFTMRDKGWDGLVNPTWPFNDYKTFPGKLVVSQPTFPKGQGSNAACARGEYDAHWKRFGTFLVNNNRADSIVRLGWEFNGTFMYWNSGPNPADFKTCWQRVSKAIKSTNPKALMDWTINAHASPVPASGNPWDAYPGDEYVDIVGIDSYDHWPPSKDEATWNKQCNGPNGMCYFMDYARKHGKKVGVGEWGVTSCSRNGGGDNPFYIKKMFETFMAYKDVMAYDTYFHDPQPGNVCTTIVNGGQNPRSSTTYKSLFGAA